MTDSAKEKDTIARTMCSFSSLGLHNWLTGQCKSMGISKPTPVQQNCIPPILRGQDCIGCAKTGSGKTAAFALPILQKLSEDPFGIFCLVITPTRELAFQIGDQFRVLGKPIGVKDSVIVGGFDMIRQGLELSKKPHIVISTPGRLADHINSTDTCDLKNIKFLVLDEADRLLEGNYGPDLEVIFDAIPAKRQTLLFSATITDTMKELRKVSMNKPFYWISKAPVATVEELDQRYCLVPAQVKDAYLMHIVHRFCTEEEGQSIIIFTSTCKYCHSLAIMLRQMEVPCVALHSLVKQRTRLASLAMFKSNQVRVLVEYGDFFGSLSRLVQLNLENNAITSLEYGDFFDSYSIWTLDLSVNLIEELPPGVFWGSSLGSLDLSFNLIRRLNNESFIALDYLVELYLSSNIIDRLPKPVLRPLQSSIELIDLRWNRLTRITNQFSNMTSLANLGLSRNSIARISPEAFQGATNLRGLFLDSNRLSTVSEETFTLPNLVDVKLYDNPWHCDCRIKWMREAMSEPKKHPWMVYTDAQGVESYKGIKCASPAAFENFSMFTIKDDETFRLVCTTYVSPLAIEFIVGISFAIIASSTLCYVAKLYCKVREMERSGAETGKCLS